MIVITSDSEIDDSVVLHSSDEYDLNSSSTDLIPCSHERVYRDEIDPIRNGSVSDRLLERCSHVQQRRRTEVNMIVVMWA